MLSKLKQIKDPAAQEKYLAELTEKARKNIQQFIEELNQQLVEDLIKGEIMLGQNFMGWLQLAITLLSVQECHQYAGDGEKKGSTPALRLLEAVGTLKTEQKHQKINSLLGKYSSIEQSMVLHTFIPRYCLPVPQAKLPRVLPIFIRLSSYIIEKYMQLRNEPAKGEEDRMEEDKVVLKCCEKWVANNIGIFFNNLGKVQDRQVKELVLMAIGDVIGALLETDRENLLDKQLTAHLLEKVLLTYVRRNYRLNEIQTSFLASLHNKKFNNPIKKIEIPEIYSDFSLRKVGLNTQAYVYMILQLLKSGLSMMNSNELMLKILVPAVGEILSRPYELKLQAIHLLQRYSELSGPIKISTGQQHNYPIQLLFFYLYQYEKEKYDQIQNNFIIENEEDHVSSLLVLWGLELENLGKEKEKYILFAVGKYGLHGDKAVRLFLFLGGINFKQQKSKRQLLLLDTVGKLKGKFQKQALELVSRWKKEGGEGLEGAVKSKIDQLMA